jgi:hypothetical protein
LYGKIGEELGIASDSQRGINKLTYIQLDVSNFQNKIAKFTIENIKKDGGFALYGSNIQGSIGDLLYSSSDVPSIQSINISVQKKYISITAAGSSIDTNVLLQSIDFTI